MFCLTSRPQISQLFRRNGSQLLSTWEKLEQTKKRPTGPLSGFGSLKTEFNISIKPQAGYSTRTAQKARAPLANIPKGVPGGKGKEKEKTTVERVREFEDQLRRPAVTRRLSTGEASASSSKPRPSQTTKSDSETKAASSSGESGDETPAPRAGSSRKVAFQPIPEVPIGGKIKLTRIPGTLPKTKMSATATFRKPYVWEKSVPKFDGKTASSLRRFLKQCQSIIKESKITDAQELKDVVLEYVFDDYVKEQFQKLAAYPAGTFEGWCKEIESLYPELEDIGTGSLQNLAKICTEAKAGVGLSQKDLGAIRRFNASFSNEAEKLLRPPASVTNKMLVDLILSTLEPSFASSVELLMNQKMVMDNTTTTAQPAAQVQPSTTTSGQQAPGPQNPGIARRGDRLNYKVVLEIAEKIADNWSGRDSSLILSGFSSLFPGGDRVQPSLMQGGLLDELKREVGDKFDLVSGELASIKDSAVVQDKQWKESFEKMENALKESIRASMIQYSRDPPPHQNMNNSGGGYQRGPERAYGTNSDYGPRTYSCYFCHGSHLIRDCPEREEYIRIGWMKIEHGKMYFGDGSGPVPRFPESKSRKMHIDDHYAAKGITKEMAGRNMNMMQSQSGYYNQYDDENLDHIYDTRADERLSNYVQMAMMNNAYRTPSHPMPNQGPVMPQYQGQYAQAATPQMPVSPPMNNQSGVCNIPADSLVQLLNLVTSRNEESRGATVQGESQEQLLSTRSGKTVQGSSPRNF